MRPADSVHHRRTRDPGELRAVPQTCACCGAAPSSLTIMGNVANLLDRPTYGFGEVDRLLHLRGGTAQRWIDGYERGGKSYSPVVRAKSTCNPIVTWGEFVEARYLSEFRDAGVSLQRMRPAIEKLRERFDTKYPLAHAKPFTDGRDIVLGIEDKLGLDPRLRMCVVRNGQILLTTSATLYYSSTEFDRNADDRAYLVRPMAQSAAQVTIDPLRSGGLPVVRGVKTEVIAEQFQAGASVSSIASTFELSDEQVQDALRYEAS